MKVTIAIPVAELAAILSRHIADRHWLNPEPEHLDLEILLNETNDFDALQIEFELPIDPPADEP